MNGRVILLIQHYQVQQQYLILDDKTTEQNSAHSGLYVIRPWVVGAETSPAIRYAVNMLRVCVWRKNRTRTAGS